MYCPNCGSTIDSNAEICINCGVNVRKFTNGSNATDEANVWVNILSLCCFPILGIIMYFVWKDQQPKAAKSALIFALVGFGITILLSIIFFVFGIIASVTDDSFYYY